MPIYTIAELRAKIDELEALGDKTLCVAITSALDIQNALKNADINVSLETADSYLGLFSDALDDAYNNELNCLIGLEDEDD